VARGSGNQNGAKAALRGCPNAEAADVVAEAEKAEPDTARMLSWHITDNPKFSFDPKRHGVINTTLGGQMTEPGLFVTQDPESWVNGHDYVRAFIAEIEHPVIEHSFQANEHYLPAALYDQSVVKRVIPLDEYVREHFHDQGWIEGFHDDGLPPVAADYRYDGPDAREMSAAVVRRHRARVKEYLKAERPQVFQRYDKSGEPISLRKEDGSLKAPGKRLPRPDALDDKAASGTTHTQE
jgi:hypothetical protein